MIIFLFSICERLPVPDYFLSGHRTSTCSWICRLQPLFEMSLAQFNLLHHFWIGFFPPLISIWIFFSKGFVFILNMSYNIWYFDFSYYILSKLLKSCQVWTHMNLPMKHLMFWFLQFIPLCLTWCQKFNNWLVTSGFTDSWTPPFLLICSCHVAVFCTRHLLDIRTILGSRIRLLWFFLIFFSPMFGLFSSASWRFYGQMVSHLHSLSKPSEIMHKLWFWAIK